MKQRYDILNLGAGVQSTTLYLLACEGELKFDFAIFADTQSEPKAVYRHLEWLKTQSLDAGGRGPKILVRTGGNLKNDLLRVVPAAQQQKKIGRFASIPAFTAPPHENRPADYDAKRQAGRVQRQCTKDYKSMVCERCIRREILGLRPKQRLPAGWTRVYQYFGISADEAGRATRIATIFDDKKKGWARPVFPLLERRWSRVDCRAWLEDRVPHDVPRSACTFCPFKDDTEWARQKAEDPEAWREAVEVDAALRHEDCRAGKGLNDKLYLHRLCIPLEMVDLSHAQPASLDPMTTGECLGMCGN